MTPDTATPASPLGATGADPIEDRLRETVRATIEALFDEDLAACLGRIRYGRGDGARKGFRHGWRERELVGAFGAETVSVPRARIEGHDGKTPEWRSKAPPRCQRLTKRAETTIAAVHLAGTNTRRVKRALYCLFRGAVGKDVVSRAWRKAKVDRDAWRAGSLADEDVVRLILDGAVNACSRTGRPPTSRRRRPSACAATAGRPCCRSGAWAARAPRRGASSSTPAG